jgi:hypothetical protein
VINTRLMIIGLLVGCQPWTWPGDTTAATALARAAGIDHPDKRTVGIEGRLWLRIKEVEPYPDGETVVVVRRCGGRVEMPYAGAALSTWLPEGACVAQLDERPNDAHWLKKRDVSPFARVYVDPAVAPDRIARNLADNASFAADATSGSVVRRRDLGPTDFVYVLRTGENGCLPMEEAFRFRVLPRRGGGSYVLVTLQDEPIEPGSASWLQVLSETSRPTGAFGRLDED